MLDFITKYKIRILAGVTLLAALVFYSLNLRQKEQANIFERAVITATTPVTELVDRVDGYFLSIWNNYIDLVDVEKENRKLRETVRILNKRVIENREALLENERLKKLTGMREKLAVPSVAASVISEDSSPWFNTIIIDRGEADGIREGMPVIGTAGVVGRIVKTARNSSRVLLLTDHASGIAAVVQRSRARGVVKGKGGNSCSLEFLQRGEDVKIGDVVITSGIGGVFPKGLPVGEITMVKKGEYGIFQTVEIRPFVFLPKLEEVLVILQKNEV
jgi:rod shape-determining protein MreC